MATKKAVKVAATKKAGRGGERSSNEPPTAKELADAISRAKLVASGKKNGCIIVVEEFEEKGQKGITGMTYWHGLGVDTRAQVIASVSGMPRSVLVMLLMQHLGHDHD